MAEPRGVEVLQSEIKKAEDKLRGYNENIKKLTGRDPTRPGIRRLLSGEGAEREENDFSGRAARGRGRIFGLARHDIMEDNGPPAKRRAVGGAFSRLGPMPGRRREREDSPYEEELPNKLSVHSSVVATSRESKNREEIMQEQTKDKEGMQRNRRMFGLLLGTLNKFKTDSKTMETKEVQRKKIEDKLEENAEKEKRKFKQETKLLIEEMHLEQSKISRLQQKMEMVQEHADCELEVKKLKNFIVTKTTPRIFWRPTQMSATLENKLKESKKFVDGMLQVSSDRLEKEIKELMEREVKREERIKMRLREDGLLEDGEGAAEGLAVNRTEREGNRESGRTIVEVKEEMGVGKTLTDRLGRRFEAGGMGAESDDAEDVRKKPRRTVVVEREESSSSETEDEDADQEEQEKDIETSKSINTDKGEIVLDRDDETVQKDVASSADEMETDKETHTSHTSKPRTEKDSESRKEFLEDENSDDDADVDVQRSGKKIRDTESHRSRKDRSDGKKERHNKNNTDEREKEKDSRRKDGGKKSSKHDSEDRAKSRKDRHDAKHDSEDREKSRKDRHETKHDKERKRDKYDEGKKHSSRHKKDKKRRSDSDESDIEIKRENDVSASRNKDHDEEQNVEVSRAHRKSKTDTKEGPEMLVV